MSLAISPGSPLQPAAPWPAGLQSWNGGAALQRLGAYRRDQHLVELQPPMAARAIAMWPRCGGSKVPPKKAMRIGHRIVTAVS